MYELNDFQKEVWEQNYKDKNDKTIEDTWKRVANTIGQNETEEIKKNFYQILENFKFVPGGRIIANAGTNTKATLLNCFVAPKVDYDIDSIEGIYKLLNYFATTLAKEGGIGANFSFIRPEGEHIKGANIGTPGPLAFLELFDKSSEMVTKGTAKVIGKNTANRKKKVRKGAQMGILNVDFSDIENFITAKQKSNSYTKFNFSVGIIKDFMEAVIQDKEWELKFPDTSFEKYKKEWDGNLKKWESKGYPILIYRKIKAKELWNKIMENSYIHNEPGVLFLDLANKLHPLNYCEEIEASNPCFAGETMVAVADGRNAVSIKQLAEEKKPFLVYSGRKSNKKKCKTEIKKAVAFKSGTKKVIRVHLSDGSSFRCTPDHLLAMPGMEYIEAKDSVGKELEKFFTFSNTKTNKSYRIINSKTNGYSRQYRMLWEYHYGSYDGKLFNIDHIDEDSTNDKITNLKLLSISEHNKKTKRKNLFNPIHKCDKEYLRLYSAEANIKANAKKYDWTDERKNNALEEFHNSEKGQKLQKLREERSKPQKTLDDPIYVAKIEDTNEVVDVYDLTVEDNHNFFIITKTEDEKYLNCSGILVHNCGEILLPESGACLLGSINLTKFVTKDRTFNFEDFKKTIKYAVRFLDNVIDITEYPLPQYEERLKQSRRIGLGIMGVGSLLYMLGIKYGNNKECLTFIEKLMKIKVETELLASVELAKEKGSFPLFNKEKYFNTYWWKNLKISEKIKKEIEDIGYLRNGVMSAIAPNGNTGIFAGIVSGGVEPVFMKEYIRWSIVPPIEQEKLQQQGFKIPNKNNLKETKYLKFVKKGKDMILKGSFNNIDYEIDSNRGLIKATLVEDFGWKYLKNNNFETSHCVDTTSLTVDDHLETLKIFAHYVSSSISKTINLPEEYSFENFKDIYLKAWKYGIKGVTTYRAGTMSAVLEAKETKIKKQKSKLQELFDSYGDKVITHDVKLPDEYPINGYILRDNGKKKWYVNLAFASDEKKRPFAIFVSTNNRESNEVTSDLIHDIERLCLRYKIDIKLVNEQLNKIDGQSNVTKMARMLGMALRHNIPMQDIVNILDTYDPGISSFIFHIKKLLSKFIPDETIYDKETCPNCKSELIYIEGCVCCKNCGWSKC